MIGFLISLTAVGGIFFTVLTACAVDERELGTEQSSPIVDFVPVLHDLSSVNELKTVFNQDMGQTRVFLLLSPT